MIIPARIIGLCTAYIQVDEFIHIPFVVPGSLIDHIPDDLVNGEILAANDLSVQDIQNRYETCFQH